MAQGNDTPIEEDAAFAAALQAAAMASVAAEKVLAASCWLGGRRIPFSLLSGWVNAVELRGAIDSLAAHDLARPEVIEGGTVAFGVRPAVQEAMRKRLVRMREDGRAIAVAARLVTEAYPKGDLGDVLNWQACERLHDHARAVLAHAADDGPDAATTSLLLHKVSQYLFGRARYDEAEPIVRRAGAIDEELLGRDHPQVGQDRANLAILLYEMGRHEEALPHIRRAVAIGEAEFGPEHPAVAERYNVLATLLDTLGRPAEADPFIRHALIVAERVLGRDHPETGVYRHNYERIITAVERMATRDDAVEAGLVPAPPERLARHDIPPPGVAKRGVLGRLLKRV